MLTDYQIKKTYGPLYNYALKLTQFNVQNAKDITQDTMLKALVNRDKYNNKYNPLTWCKNIMHNLFIDKCRKAKLCQCPIEIAFEIPDKNEYLSMDISKACKFFMSKLKAKNSLYAYAIHQFSIGFSHKEISEEIGISNNTLRTSMWKINEYMNKKYGKMYEKVINN